MTLQQEQRKGPGRPRINHDRRRDEIVKIATRLFARQGYNGTSITDICDAAGIGRGVLYHYVSSKEEILTLIHERFIHPLLDRVRKSARPEDEPDVTLQKVSLGLLDTIFDYHDEVTVFLHEWKALVGNEEIFRKIRKQRRAFEAIIEDAIKRGTSSGLFRDVDPKLAMLAFLNLHNYTYQWLDPRGPVNYKKLSGAFIDIFLRGLYADMNGQRRNDRKIKSSGRKV